MSNAKLVKDTLEALGYPAFHGLTTTNKRVYFIYYFMTEPADHADDRPLSETTYAQIHLFCKEDFDPLELIEQTKRALFNAGYTWPEVETLATGNTGYGEANDMRHFFIECEKNDFISVE